MRLPHKFILSLLLICNSIAQAQGVNDTIAVSRDPSKFDAYLFEAVNRKLKQEYDAALELYRHCYSINPNDPALLFELSSIYFGLARSADAITLMERAYRLEPDNKNYALQLATFLDRSSRSVDAAEIMSSLVKRYPDDAELQFSLASLYVRMGEIDKAISLYREVEKNNASSPMDAANYSDIRARIFFMVGQSNKAIEEYRSLVKRYPEISEFRMKLVAALLDNNSYNEAYSQLKEIAKLGATDGMYHFALASYYLGTKQHELAVNEIAQIASDKEIEPERSLPFIVQFIHNDDLDEDGLPKAENNHLFELLKSQHPSYLEIRIAYIQTLVKQANFEKAEQEAKECIAIAPSDERAWYLLLEQAYNRAEAKNNYDELILFCQKAEAQFPQKSIYYLHHAVSLYKQNNKPAAKEVLLEAVKLVDKEEKNGLSDIFSQLADLEYEEGNQDQAFDYYDKSLKYNPMNIGVLNNYAYFLAINGGDLEKSERMAAQAVKYDPKNSVLLDTYAWIFFLQKKYSLAKLYIEKAIDESKDNPDADVYEHYGDILYMLNKHEEAYSYWLQAKKIGGGGSKFLDAKIAQKTYVAE